MKFVRRLTLAAAAAAGIAYIRARLRTGRPVLVEAEPELSPDEEMRAVIRRNQANRDVLAERIAEAAARDAGPHA